MISTSMQNLINEQKAEIDKLARDLTIANEKLRDFESKAQDDHLSSLKET
jgi:hypothetical protein